MTLDYEVQPGENTPALAETEVLVYYDQSRLYVGFRARKPTEAPRHLRRRTSDGFPHLIDELTRLLFSNPPECTSSEGFGGVFGD